MVLFSLLLVSGFSFSMEMLEVKDCSKKKGKEAIETEVLRVMSFLIGESTGRSGKEVTKEKLLKLIELIWEDREMPLAKKIVEKSEQELLQQDEVFKYIQSIAKKEK